MNFEEIDRYILSKQGATFDYPFDKKVRVYRIANKMFALTNEHEPLLRVNLKCDPIYALELRSIYEGVSAGYHMNKKHWNTVMLEETDVDEKIIKELINHSYELVSKSLKKSSEPTQYELEIKGEYADIFKAIREILLSYPQMKELKNAKQTSYSDEYGVVIMMRNRGDVFVVAFGKGSKLQEQYPMLQGTGKIVRHLYFKNVDEVDEKLLREMIEESFILGMEAFEMKEMKKFI